MDTGTRTGIAYLSNDGSDPVTAYRTSIRNIAAWAEAQSVQYVQQSAAPAPGIPGRFFKDSDTLGDGVIYWDNGTSLEAIGGSAPTDAAAGVGSLRTLGTGALQAAAGNHTHSADAILGAGGDNLILTLGGAL